jgi:hypothetical protein
VIIQAVAVEVDPADQLVRPKRMRAVPAGSTAFERYPLRTRKEPPACRKEGVK